MQLSTSIEQHVKLPLQILSFCNSAQSALKVAAICWMNVQVVPPRRYMHTNAGGETEVAIAGTLTDLSVLIN
jgi:hypothetical protein